MIFALRSAIVVFSHKVTAILLAVVCDAAAKVTVLRDDTHLPFSLRV